MKPITVCMYGGPFNGKPLVTTTLQDHILFRFPADKTIIVYSRENEVDYVYNHKMTCAFTFNYDGIDKLNLGFTPCDLVIEEGKKDEDLSGGTNEGDSGV